MGSLLGKALAVRNAVPVPLGDGGGGFQYPGLATGTAADGALMRSYASNGTLFANVSMLARATAGPVWKLFRQAPQDGRQRYTTSDQGSDQRVEVIRHQALSVLYKPASMTAAGREMNFWSRFGLFELSQIWMETTGKAHWVVEYDPRANFPVGLWPVRPDRMIPVPDPGQYLKGWIYIAPDGRTKIPLQPWEVIYNRYPDPMDAYGGVGPVGSVLTDLDAVKYAAEYNRNYFLNSAVPGGVLQADHELGDDEFNRLTNRWRESHKGVSRAHRIALLEAGVTWVPTHTSMKDMDFAALRMDSRDIIREALAMHKVMTGVTDDVNRANAQTGEEVFASWLVGPRCERWRDVLNTQFLPLFGAAGQGVEFDFVLPLPRNREQDNLELKTKAEAALALVTGGYDQHDVLVAVGLPDMKTVLQLSDQPALPPRWTPAVPEPDATPPDAPAAAGAPQASLGIRAGKDTQGKVVEQLAQDYPAHAMAWVHHASWSGPADLPISHIDPDMQWVGPADPAHVQDFVKLLEDGKKVQPVILVKTPKSPKLQLADGHHRYLAYGEVEQPVRSYIATVGAEHGGWEHMHRYQKRSDGSGGPKAEQARQMAAWNALAGAR
jgi:phage portal protein BeeE